MNVFANRIPHIRTHRKIRKRTVLFGLRTPGDSLGLFEEPQCAPSKEAGHCRVLSCRPCDGRCLKRIGPLYRQETNPQSHRHEQRPGLRSGAQGQGFNESIIVNPDGTLANVFVYIKSGLEGKQFEVPQTPVPFDQRGCWFVPRVLGVQTGQILRITNSDPVNHNIHALARSTASGIIASRRRKVRSTASS